MAEVARCRMKPYYAAYRQHGTDTGRLASDFQQVPRVVPGQPNLRDAVRAPAGMVLVEADYSQIELRLIAWRAQEETMLRLLREGDLHAYSGRMLFGVPDEQQVSKLIRQTGKTVNFSLGYEAGSDKLAEIMLLSMSDSEVANILTLLKCEKLGEAASHLWHRWHETYPGIRRWHAREKVEILRVGKSVAPHGRIKHVPKAFSRIPKERAEGLREGINHVIQSPATDLTLLAAVLAAPRLAADGALGPWPSHDSLLFAVYNAVYAGRILQQVMEVEAPAEFERLFGVRLDVPIKADVKAGERWGSLLPLDMVADSR